MISYFCQRCIFFLHKTTLCLFVARHFCIPTALCRCHACKYELEIQRSFKHIEQNSQQGALKRANSGRSYSSKNRIAPGQHTQAIGSGNGVRGCVGLRGAPCAAFVSSSSCSASGPVLGTIGAPLLALLRAPYCELFPKFFDYF